MPKYKIRKKQNQKEKRIRNEAEAVRFTSFIFFGTRNNNVKYSWKRLVTVIIRVAFQYVQHCHTEVNEMQFFV